MSRHAAGVLVLVALGVAYIGYVISQIGLAGFIYVAIIGSSFIGVLMFGLWLAFG